MIGCTFRAQLSSPGERKHKQALASIHAEQLTERGAAAVAPNANARLAAAVHTP